MATTDDLQADYADLSDIKQLQYFHEQAVIFCLASYSMLSEPTYLEGMYKLLPTCTLLKSL